MVSHTRLKEALHYEPVTGVWTRLTGKHAGKPVGSITKKGYRQIVVDGQLYLSARLAWFYMTGEWPSRLVDHKRPGAKFRADDRWGNLRLATVGQNNANRLSKVLKGVTRRPSGRFVARMGHGNCTTLGTFDTAEEAHAAYVAEANKRYGEFAQGGERDIG
jgi:hypothetical protein